VYTDFRHAGVQVLVNDGSGILLEDQFLNVGYMPNPVLTGDLQGDSWSDLTFPSNFGTNGVLVSQNAVSEVSRTAASCPSIFY
jgi:hypothetical protein